MFQHFQAAPNTHSRPNYLLLLLVFFNFVNKYFQYTFSDLLCKNTYDFQTLKRYQLVHGIYMLVSLGL